jgi:hypothetical protein
MARAGNINSQMLVRARESAGLSSEEAAERLGLTTSERQTATHRRSDRPVHSHQRPGRTECATLYASPRVGASLAGPNRGSSGSPERTEPTTQVGRIEQFCNDVAGEFLLPARDFREIPEDLNEDSFESASRFVDRLANSWGVSEPMIAFKLQRLGWISSRTYRELARHYARRWVVAKQRAREQAKESAGGPSYYTVKRFKLGDALLDVVRRTLRENNLSHTAAKVLGVGLSSVEPLIRTGENRSASTLLKAMD